MFLRKHVGHILQSMGLRDIDPSSPNNWIAIVAHGKLSSSFQVQSDPALNVFSPLIPLRLGLHRDSGSRQARQFRSQLLQGRLQCR